MIAFQLAVLKLIRKHKPDLLKGTYVNVRTQPSEYSALALSEIIDEGDVPRFKAVVKCGALMGEASENEIANASN